MKVKQLRKISYRSSTQQGEKVPCLPLQGIFLNQYGFQVGDRVNVDYSLGFIHISKIIRDQYGDSPPAV